MNGCGLMALCFAFPLLSRLYTLAIPVPLNVDEAQWTVSARRILDDPIVWRSNDLTTSGPLNALVISWPYLFGFAPSIFTSRLTGLLLQSGALLGVAKLIRPADVFGFGTAAVLTMATFLALSTNVNYLHYSSEALSLVLIVLFCIVFIKLDGAPQSAWRWALCGLIATSLPLAKMQSAPFCLLFHAACAGRLLFDLRRGRASWGQAFAYMAGGVLPALVLIAPLFLVGEQQAVLTGYFGLAYGYHGTRAFYIFRKIMPLILVMAGLMAAILARRSDFNRARWDVLFLSLGLWLATFLSMWLPGRNFFHYRLYAFVALPLAVVLAQNSLPLVPGKPRALIPLLAPVAALIIFMLPARQRAVATAALESAFASGGAADRSRPLLAWAGVTPKDSLLMWGWEPGLTAYAGLKPADRASHAEYLIRPNSGRDYFRDRLLRDLGRDGKPALVLDTVRPGYIFNNYPDYKPETSDLRSFPSLYDIVLANYDQIGGVANANCPAVYLRRDLVDAWRSVEIPLRGSAAALVDGSITENCGDWWTPDKAADTAPDLFLDQPEPVRELWILASRGGPTRDRGTTRVKVRFTTPTGDQIEEVAHLFDYPLWTVISNPDGRAISHITIDTLDYVGAGPALNEVKAFRTQSGGG